MLHNTRWRPTWVEAVAGDAGALQPVGQLSGEQNVAQLAIAVGLKVAPRGLSGHRVLLGIQQREVHAAKAVQQRGHGDHAAGPAPLQPLQQEVSEQKMAQVVDSECGAEALRGAAGTHYTWSGREKTKTLNYTSGKTCQNYSHYWAACSGWSVCK